MVGGQISRRKRHLIQLARQKELGLCAIPSCKNKPVEEHTICNDHIKYFKERYEKKKLYSLIIRKGDKNGRNTRN